MSLAAASTLLFVWRRCPGLVSWLDCYRYYSNILRLPLDCTMPFPSQTLEPASSSHLGSILDVALSDYKKNTGKDLIPRELDDLFGDLVGDILRMPRLDPVDRILAELQGHVNTLEELRNGNRGSKLMKWISSLVHILYPISAILGDGFGLVRLQVVATDAHADVIVHW